MDENLNKSKYNISLMILSRVSDMQTRAANYYRLGKIDRWFFEWKNIKFQIIGKLTPDDRTNLKNMEIEILKILYDFKKSTPLVEIYVEQVQTLIEEKEIGLVSKADEAIFT